MDTYSVFFFIDYVFMIFHNFNHAVYQVFYVRIDFSVTVTGRSLTLSYVKPRGLREAIYDEFEGFRCGVQCPGQFLDTAVPNLPLHTLPQACTPDLVCTPTHEGQKPGQEKSL